MEHASTRLAEFARKRECILIRFFGDMCGEKSPLGVVRTGLLHAAAALKHDCSVFAPPFFLSKSKHLL